MSDDYISTALDRPTEDHSPNDHHPLRGEAIESMSGSSSAGAVSARDIESKFDSSLGNVQLASLTITRGTTFGRTADSDIGSLLQKKDRQSNNNSPSDTSADRPSDQKPDDKDRGENQKYGSSIPKNAVNVHETEDGEIKYELPRTNALAVEVEMGMQLELTAGASVEGAISRVRAAAEAGGHRLYDGFEEDAKKMVDYHTLQAEGEAESINHLGRQINLPYSNPDQIAAAFNALADTYEARNNGECTGAAKDVSDDNWDFNMERYAKFMTKQGDKLYQAQLGSCTLTTEVDLALKTDIDAVTQAFTGVMREGSFKDLDFTVAELDKKFFAGNQDAPNYISTALLAKSIWKGENGHSFELKDNYGGTPITWAPEAAEYVYGRASGEDQGVDRALTYNNAHTQGEYNQYFGNGEYGRVISNYWKPDAEDMEMYGLMDFDEPSDGMIKRIT